MKNHELEKKRKSLKYTSVNFAEMVGMHTNKYSEIENMKIQPTKEQAMSIALELDCDVNTLFPKGYIKFEKIYPTETPRLLEESNAKMSVAYLLKRTNLSQKEEEIISMRVGLADGITHSLEEVGYELGVTRERVRQWEAKAHERIRQSVEQSELRLIIK